MRKFNSIRDSPNDSQESYSPLASLEHLKFDRFQGGERKGKSQGYKKVSFVVPKFSKEDRVKAQVRINAAHKQVDPSVYLNPKVKRTTETLYVGNLEFSTSVHDIYLAIGGFNSDVVRVENITIPRVDGKSKYGFVELSWTQCIPLNLADVCIRRSGMIQVNSRLIYLRELRDTVNKQ